MPMHYPETFTTAEPMTVADIDNHPDRDRIWATINAAMRQEYDDQQEELLDLQEEAAQLEQDVNSAEQVISDLAYGMKEASFWVEYDKNDWPCGINHGLIAYDSCEEKEIIDALNDQLQHVVEEILDNHFREASDVEAA